MGGMNAAIDVGKQRLEVALGSGGELFSQPNELRAIKQLCRRLAQAGCARVLALYGARLEPPVRALPDEQSQALRALWVRREQLIAMLVMEHNRLKHAPPKARAVRHNLRSHIDCLREQIKHADDDLDSAVRNSPLWDKYEVLSSVPGVGPIPSVALPADLPESGRLDRREAAALSGVAPFNCDSGALRGERKIQGGRARLRRVLYVATVAAVRCNPVLTPFYLRLRAAGKPAKAAIIAPMRKLLTILNLMLKTHTLRRPPCPVGYARKVAHQSTGGMLLTIPEPVDPVGNLLT